MSVTGVGFSAASIVVDDGDRWVKEDVGSPSLLFRVWGEESDEDVFVVEYEALVETGT